MRKIGDFKQSISKFLFHLNHSLGNLFRFLFKVGYLLLGLLGFASLTLLKHHSNFFREGILLGQHRVEFALQRFSLIVGINNLLDEFFCIKIFNKQTIDNIVFVLVNLFKRKHSNSCY